jgi:hypothetical protein
MTFGPSTVKVIDTILGYEMGKKITFNVHILRIKRT